MGFAMYVRYQNDSGYFCCLVLFSLYSGKHGNFIEDYDGTLKGIKTEEKIMLAKTFKQVIAYCTLMQRKML